MMRLAVLVPILSGFSGFFAAAERPNLLFILADDMGWQDTSVAFARERTKFNDRFHTPALERLAREGMKFTQAYSCAVCSPTRVNFLTGQNAARHGVTQWTHITGRVFTIIFSCQKSERATLFPAFETFLSTLVYYHGDQRLELFHLAEDLSEEFNLADREPERVRELANELTGVLRQHHAPMPRVKATGEPVSWPIDVLQP